MQFGFVAATGGARETVDLAVSVEEHGWDGFFTWDALSVGVPVTWDPWALLGAVAARTSRVRLGAMVFALPRHPPWTLVRQVQTLDHLSSGRLVLPVGLGVADDAAYSRVGPVGTVGGEPMSARERAERLDDALDVLDAAASGGSVSVQGRHSELSEVVLEPGTVQRPRVPVWVVGAWPSRRSLARAARWDGIVLQRLRSAEPADAAMVREVRAEIDALRQAAGATGSFEVVLSQELPRDPAVAAQAAEEFEAAGVTWWIHADWSPDTAADEHLARVRQGPPGGL